MPPISLAPLSGRFLTFAEREEIAIMHEQHNGVCEIAYRLGRSPATILRELRRNASTGSHQVSDRATSPVARGAARQPKVAKRAANPALRDYVQDRVAGMIERPDGGHICGPHGALHRPAPWTASRPTLGNGVEP